MSRCLITGASGFVGSNLAAALVAEGRQVRCLVRSTSNTQWLDKLDVESVVGKLDDLPKLKNVLAGVSHVYHVAGRTTALRREDFFETNVIGSQFVAEACAQQTTPPTLTMVSSLAAGGPGTAQRPRQESDPDQPVSAYGKSKLAAELKIAQLADQLPISIVRPPIIFGPADHASLALYRTLRACRLHLLPGYRSLAVSLVYVADLCNALIQVAERGSRVTRDDHQRGVYYVAADRSVSYPEFGRLAGAAAGYRAVPLPVPRAMFWLVGGVGELVGRIRQQPHLLNFDKVREALAPGWVCSDEKIRSELNYQPAAPLEQRFAETVEWYREQGWL